MSTDPVATYVALLLGISEGGKNKLLMRDLTAMFTPAGGEDAGPTSRVGMSSSRLGPLQHQRKA